MNINQAFPSKFLKADELEDRDWPVTIKRVVIEEMVQGDDKQPKLIIYFEELDKGLVANKTNAGVIAKLYGPETDEWIGQRITLWPNHDVEFKGEIVSAIRVRSKAPAGRTQRSSANAEANGLLTFEQAISLCATRNISRDDLVAYLKSKGCVGWNSKRDSQAVRELVAGFEPPEPDDQIPF